MSGNWHFHAVRVALRFCSDIDVTLDNGRIGRPTDVEARKRAVALAPDHPLTAAETIDISTLGGDETVFVPRAAGHLRQRIVGLCEEARRPVPALEEVASLGAGAMMASAGSGVVIVPASTVSPSTPGGVAYRGFDRPAGPRRTCASWPRLIRDACAVQPERLSPQPDDRRQRVRAGGTATAR